MRIAEDRSGAKQFDSPPFREERKPPRRVCRLRDSAGLR
jgi:hypothetical protein